MRPQAQNTFDWAGMGGNKCTTASYDVNNEILVHAADVLFNFSNFLVRVTAIIFDPFESKVGFQFAGVVRDACAIHFHKDSVSDL